MRHLFQAVVFFASLLPLSLAAAEEPHLKIATFDVDATPPVGSMMAYDKVIRTDDLPLRLRLAEAIRAEILHRTRQEVPHATAVQIEQVSEEPALTRIEATILVERDTQKGIVIGEAGQRIKDIGSAARRRLEQILGRQVHLALWVKVRPDWRDDEPILRLLGLAPS